MRKFQRVFLNSREVKVYCQKRILLLRHIEDQRRKRRIYFIFLYSELSHLTIFLRVQYKKMLKV